VLESTRRRLDQHLPSWFPHFTVLPRLRGHQAWQIHGVKHILNRISLAPLLSQLIGAPCSNRRPGSTNIQLLSHQVCESALSTPTLLFPERSNQSQKTMEEGQIHSDTNNCKAVTGWIKQRLLKVPCPIKPAPNSAITSSYGPSHMAPQALRPEVHQGSSNSTVDELSFPVSLICN
jgi:hypothetical protein